MINKLYQDMCQSPSKIRELAEFSMKRAEIIGYDNVYDFTIGSPSVPTPDEFHNTLKELMDTQNSSYIHGYSPTHGHPVFKEAIAKQLKRKFNIEYTADHIYPTTGAAGAITHSIKAITTEGDEVITFAPYFAEYGPYVNLTGAKLVVVPPNFENFEINFDEFEKLINEKTMAILINSPTNPSGVVYSEETIKKLADILKQKSKELNHDIYIISDEPYREITFNGVKCPYIPHFYDKTIVCYSYSKTLSIPGERVGYAATTPNDENSLLLVKMFGQISRGTGHNSAPTIMQLAIAKNPDLTSDLNVYKENFKIMSEGLRKLGFEIKENTAGTFYLFPKALEEDDTEFCKKALKYDIVVVPGSAFGAKGYFRLAFCVPTQKCQNSLKAFETFVKNEYPEKIKNNLD